MERPLVRETGLRETQAAKEGRPGLPLRLNPWGVAAVSIVECGV